MLLNHLYKECNHPKIHYLIEILSLFLIGGSVYIGVEMLWRGYSHWSMFIVGGIAFLAIGGINNYFFDYKIGMDYCRYYRIYSWYNSKYLVKVGYLGLLGFTV